MRKLSRILILIRASIQITQREYFANNTTIINEYSLRRQIVARDSLSFLFQAKRKTKHILLWRNERCALQSADIVYKIMAAVCCAHLVSLQFNLIFFWCSSFVWKMMQGEQQTAAYHESQTRVNVSFYIWMNADLKNQQWINACRRAKMKQ